MEEVVTRTNITKKNITNNLQLRLQLNLKMLVQIVKSMIVKLCVFQETKDSMQKELKQD